MPPRVLIVEDDGEQSRRVAQALAEQRPDWTLDFVAQGREALTRLKTEAFDAVLLDHQLPDLSGLEVLREIMGSKLDVGVVFATPFGNLQMAMAAKTEGACDYIQKSDLMYGQLGEVLETCIQVQHIRREVRRTQQDLIQFERNSALAQLSLTIRHEINNPLAALCAYTEMLLHEVKNQPELRRRVQQIYDEAIRIRDVVRRTEDVRDELQEYLPGLKMIRLADSPVEKAFPSPGELPKLPRMEK